MEHKMDESRMGSSAGRIIKALGTRIWREPVVWLAAITGPMLLPAQVIDGDPVYHVLPPDAILAIYHPEFVSGEQARRIMTDWEQVIGIVGPGGTAVAYSTWHLDRHEIVDDLVDGLPLAVTW